MSMLATISSYGTKCDLSIWRGFMFLGLIDLIVMVANIFPHSTAIFGVFDTNEI